MKFVAASLAIASLLPFAAHAASSEAVASEGGSVRLVTTGLPDSEGKLQAALRIELKPGWKTYWRDPGEAGIPPSLDTAQSANIRGARIEFPAPTRIDDGFADTAGYHRPVSLPVKITYGDPNGESEIRAHVFLGLCKSICIPLQAELAVDPAADPNNADDARLVEEAVASLPADASPGFGAVAAHVEGDVAVIEAHLPPEAASPALFLAGGDGYLFGLPTADGKTTDTYRFRAKIFQKPETAPKASPAFHYTLVAGDRAVSGRIGFD